MNGSIDPRDRQRLENLVDGRLSATELAQLAADLQGNPTLQAELIDLMHFEESLAYHLASSSGTVNRPAIGELLEANGEDFQPALSGSMGSFIKAASESQLDGEEETRRQSGSLTPRSRFTFSRNWLEIALAASVAFVLGALAATQVFHSSPPEAAAKLGSASTEPQPAEHRSPLGTTLELSRRPVARIIGLSPEASELGLVRSMAVGDPLRCGEVVQLAVGVLHLELPDVGEVFVEGPSEFAMIDQGIILLRDGTMAVRSRAPVKMYSPKIVIDGGATEFNVHIEPQNKTQLTVLKGQLNWYENDLAEGDQLEIHRVMSGNSEEIVVKSAGKLAVTSLDSPVTAATEWSEIQGDYTAYQRTVLNDRPLAYWLLRNVSNARHVLDLTQNGFDGLAIGTWAPQAVDAGQQPWTSFDGESYIEVANKPPIDWRTGFTVEAWAKPHWQNNFRALFTSRWTAEGSTPNQRCYGFTLYAGDTNRWELWCGSGRYNHGWQRLQSPAPIDYTAWSHVVATFTPERELEMGLIEGTARLFIDGTEVASDMVTLALHDFAWPARIGAAESVPKALTSWLYLGDLRDVAVYDRPLSESSIATHFTAAGDSEDSQLIDSVSATPRTGDLFARYE